MRSKEKIHIDHPEAWELLVSIGDKRLQYILYTPEIAGSLIVGEATAEGYDPLQALEDATYGTEGLLNDYSRVRVIVHSPHFILLPQATSDEDCLMLLRQAFPAALGDEAVNVLPQEELKIAFVMPRGMRAFLGRTFNYPAVYHHLYPLCEHLHGQASGDDLSRMFLNLNDKSMDMAIYSKGQLVCANSYPFNNHEDATYYALNAWRTHGLDQLTDELQLMGDPETRAAMTPLLREYVKFVMPAVYPAQAMQLGRNAMQAPLELILLALCE